MDGWPQMQETPRVTVTLEWTAWDEKWQRLVCETTVGKIDTILDSLWKKNPMINACQYKIIEVAGDKWEIIYSKNQFNKPNYKQKK